VLRTIIIIVIVLLILGAIGGFFRGRR